MPIDLDCPSCGRTLRVDDKYAGRRGTCPACKSPLLIPEDSPLLEILPEDRRTYDNVILPSPKPAPPPAPKQDPAEEAEEWRDPRLVRLDRLREEEEAAKRPPWWNRPFLDLFGVKLTPLVMILIPLMLAGVGFWYARSAGQPAKVINASPVFVVEVLHTGDTLKPVGSSTAKSLLGGGFQGMGASGGSGPVTPYTAPTGKTRTNVFSVGGRDQLVVTQADPDGDYVLLEIALQQKIINNLGQFSGYDSILKEGEFELRRISDPPGAGTTGRLVSATFDQPIDLDLAGANTSNYRALFPASAKPDRVTEDKIPGVVNGEAEYALSRTQGTISFTASRSVQGYPAMKGLNATGKLVTTHADKDGPTVTADYQGGTLNVSWDPGAQAHWTVPKMVEKTRTSPWDRYTFSLLFPRPDTAGKYKLSFAGKDVATVKLGRAKQPSAPAPSPIASQRPGGPQAASKQSSSPLAYFDVLRDAKSQANGLVSANNMRQIGIALQTYMDQNNGRFPDTLLQLREVFPQLDQVMENPRTGDRPGFIYEKPPPGSAPSRTPVLYESLNGQKDPDGAVLYGDGSIR
ncbi:hypothetical protein [Algisphaera agarilytica]|uniref:Uncharacterized protein n=1 Tax=Algisphaera agarilytica TaxID=1385975 RepID=A0A7X0H4G9_9BACT|nr:hypothetical protein [Algisphaera agarilytica]MBB6428908.1 hypothetical protein [Algisphaera agarilytica]